MPHYESLAHFDFTPHTPFLNIFIAASLYQKTMLLGLHIPGHHEAQNYSFQLTSMVKF